MIEIGAYGANHLEPATFVIKILHDEKKFLYLFPLAEMRPFTVQIDCQEGFFFE